MLLNDEEKQGNEDDDEECEGSEEAQEKSHTAATSIASAYRLLTPSVKVRNLFKIVVNVIILE